MPEVSCLYWCTKCPREFTKYWEHSDEHCSQGLYIVTMAILVVKPFLVQYLIHSEGLRQHEESIMGEAAGWELRSRMCKANSTIRGGNGVGQAVGYRELQ